MALKTLRSQAVLAVVARLQDQVPGFDLVKAFDGDAWFLRDPDAYNRAVNGRYPSALVLSEGRAIHPDSINRMLAFRHVISVYIATQDFRGPGEHGTPTIYDLADSVVDALHGYSPGGGVAAFRLGSDRRRHRSDFLAIYESQWEVTEHGR